MNKTIKMLIFSHTLFTLPIGLLLFLPLKVIDRIFVFFEWFFSPYSFILYLIIHFAFVIWLFEKMFPENCKEEKIYGKKNTMC